MSKGSKQRLKQITDEELDRRWEQAFSKIRKQKNRKDRKYHYNIEIK